MAEGWYWKEGEGRADRTTLLTRSRASRVVLCASGSKLMTRDPAMGILVQVKADMAIAKMIARAPLMVAALYNATLKFREYADMHLAKCTPEGDAKARANREMADLCEQALAGVEVQDA